MVDVALAVKLGRAESAGIHHRVGADHAVVAGLVDHRDGRRGGSGFLGELGGDDLAVAVALAVSALIGGTLGGVSISPLIRDIPIISRS